MVAGLVEQNEQDIQSNINAVYDWSVQTHMPLSINKCLMLHCDSNNPSRNYFCGPDKLPKMNRFADLGVLCSEKGHLVII